MNAFLILLALAYASSEKLDLTYLPPPGSQYAGGRPEDIQFPLEFPKAIYSTTLRPQLGNNRGMLNPEYYKATVGIDRGVPPVSQDTKYVSPGSTPITEFKNTYKLPTTTVSYAFTQTTTHPPLESFETTIGPQFIGDYPTPGSFNIPSQEAYPTHEGNIDSHVSPGYKQIINKFGPQPTSGSITVSTPSLDDLLPQKPENIISDHLNFTSPGQLARYPNDSTKPSGENKFRQKYLEGQQYFSQMQPGQQRPSTDRSGAFQSQFRNQNMSKHFEGTTIAPQGSLTTSQSSGILPNGDGISIAPGASTTSSTISQSIFPGSQGSEEGFQPSIAGGPRFQLPTYPQQISNGPLLNQQPYGSQFEKQFGKAGYRQKVIQPYSNSAPILTNVGVSDEQVPSETFSTPGLFSTTSFPNTQDQDNQEPSFGYDNVNLPEVNGEKGNIFGQPSSTVTPIITTGVASTELPDINYPTSTSYDAGSQLTPVFGARPGSTSSTYRKRPKNPQAEADHNAVILNYENVITPEGFAYTFDTSNGIHADESGTATDGVNAKGSYSYIGDDGKVYSVVYTADENGFRLYGDHLPTSPPIPEAIQRILEKVEEEKKAGISHDGFYDEEKYGFKKYQSAVSRNPQHSSKSRLNGTVISQVGQNRPLIIEKDPSDFTDANPEQNIAEGVEITGSNKEIQTVGLISTQRPLYPITEEEYTTTINDALPDKNDENYLNRGSNYPLVETSPRRPLIPSVRKQNSNKNVPYSYEAPFHGGNIGSRPIVKAPFLQVVGSNQKYNEYNRKKLPENERNSYKEPLKRPSAQSEEKQYEEKETTLPVNNEDITSLRRPLISGTIRRPITNIKIEKEKTENTYNRPVLPSARIPIRRPNNEIITENYPGFYNNGDDFSKQPTVNVNRPGDYNSEENYESSSSTKVTPDSVTRLSNMFVPRNQNGLVRRRPVSNRVPNTIKADKNNEYQLVDNDTLEDSRVDNKGKLQYDNSRYSTQSSILPSKTNGRYLPENELVGDNQSPSIKFGQKIVRPIVNKQSGLPENRDIVNHPSDESGYQYFPPQRKFEQDEYKRYPTKMSEDTRVESTRKPTQHLAGLNNKQATSKPFMTPNVSLDRGNAGNNYYINNYGPSQTGTSQYNDVQSSGNEFDERTSENPESGATSDQIFSDEILSSTQQPSDLGSTYRPIYQQTTSTPQYYHDEYTQQIPGFTRQGAMQRVSSKPGFYEENGLNNKTPYLSSTAKVPSARPFEPSEEVSRPGQNIFYHSRPSQGFTSSTTPFPSQRTKIGSSFSQATMKPQFQTTYRPTETIRPTSEYSDGTKDPRLPTEAPYAEVTFGTELTHTTKNDGNLPSTTYRPNYTVAVQNEPVSTENSGEFLVDGYGRPIVPPNTRIQEYASGEQNEPPSSLRPELDQFGLRPIKPVLGSGYQQTPSLSTSFENQQGIVTKNDQENTGPFLLPSEQNDQQKYKGGSPLPNGHEKDYRTRITEPTRPFGSTLKGHQKYQSSPQYQPSTERIIGEDFSGPKQQQKFDPKTGYYY